MSGFYEGDGHEIRSCDLALYFYRKESNGVRNGEVRFFAHTMRAMDLVLAALRRPPRRDPTACACCHENLDDLEIVAVRDPVVVQLGQLCRMCLKRQERMR